MNTFRLEEVNDYEEWNDFVDESPQGTIFSYTNYLSLAVDYWRIYWIKKGDQIKAGIVLLTDTTGTKVVIDDLVIHNGLMFPNEGDQKVVKARLERFKITEFVIEWLTQNYQQINLSLAPQFEDIRPFLWYNYHSNNLNDKFRVDLCYTSYLNISSLREHQEELQTDLFKNLETLRKRNIREAREIQAMTIAEGDGELFTHYYAAMMSYKGVPQDKVKQDKLTRMINGLLLQNKVAVYKTFNPEKELIYISVFAWDHKRSYYLFGTSTENNNDRYKGSIAFWDVFIDLAKKGINIVDLEGVNSPQRGWFKLSFGGSLVPYFELNWNR